MTQTATTQGGVPVVIPDSASILDPSAIDRLIHDPGEAPQIPGPPTCVVELPAGVQDTIGAIHTTAVVRELTGEDEEDMFRVDKAGKPVLQNEIALMDLVLSRCTVSLGSTGRPVTQMEIEAALIGDREALMIGIRRATYGDSLEIPIMCWSCKTELVADIDLVEDIKVRKLADPTQRTIEVTLRNGDIAVVRFLNGLDQRALQDTEKVKTLTEANAVVLNSCVLRIDDKEVTPAQMKKLGLGDRNKILKALENAQPGPQLLGVKVPCSTCDVENIVNIGMAHLLQGP